jgi:hypothetical protein
MVLMGQMEYLAHQVLWEHQGLPELQVAMEQGLLLCPSREIKTVAQQVV